MPHGEQKFPPWLRYGDCLNADGAEAWVPRLYAAYPSPATRQRVRVFDQHPWFVDATNIRVVASAFGGIDDECESLDNMVKHCESPIEKLMLGAFAVLDSIESDFEMHRFCRPRFRFREDECLQPCECSSCQLDHDVYDEWSTRFPDKSDSAVITLSTQDGVRGTNRRVDFRLTLRSRVSRTINMQEMIALAVGASRRQDEFTVAVEVDGHDFHERTKEQARRDKARDRELLSRGVQTVRFTGSEVWEDCRRCAREAVDLLLGMRARTDVEAV